VCEWEEYSLIDLATSRMSQKILSLLILGLSLVLSAQASNPQDWSVDLRKYGYKEWREAKALATSSQLRVAAAMGVVAVAVGNPPIKTQIDEHSDRPDANWEISLLLFDAATGKLNSKRGPWSGDMSFELFPTSQGHLLLLLQHFHQTIGEVGETLYLLSPTGDEVKKIFLAPSIVNSRQTWSTFLVSPTGSSVLVAQALADGVHYKLLDADTLETKSEWTADAGSKAPRVLAISDKEMLGRGTSKAPPTTRTVDEDPKLFVGKFDGMWTPFPASLNVTHTGLGRFWIPNQVAFLSDNTIVGVSAKREAAAASILVLRTDGTSVFSPSLPRLEPNTSLSGPVYVAQDGRSFAVGFTHRPWLSRLMLDVWKLDDTVMPDEVELIVWMSSEPIPVARLNLGNDLSFDALSLCFDDPTSVALLGRGTLKVIRAQPLP
jgi:hypothetical protein